MLSGDQRSLSFEIRRWDIAPNGSHCVQGEGHPRRILTGVFFMGDQR